MKVDRIVYKIIIPSPYLNLGHTKNLTKLF